MAWCFSTRASVATALTTHPRVSRCLGVNSSISLSVEVLEAHSYLTGVTTASYTVLTLLKYNHGVYHNVRPETWITMKNPC